MCVDVVSLYAAGLFNVFFYYIIKMIVAPALLSALAISKPIPYDAPVTKAFFTFKREHIDEIHKTPIVKNLSVITGLRFPQGF